MDDTLRASTCKCKGECAFWILFFFLPVLDRVFYYNFFFAFAVLCVRLVSVYMIFSVTTSSSLALVASPLSFLLLRGCCLQHSIYKLCFFFFFISTLLCFAAG
jgi:hypothetical protein